MPTVPSARRSAWSVLALALLAGAAIATPGHADAKKPPRLITAHHIQSVTCVPGPANTVRAKVRIRMVVVNDDGVGEWASNMEAKARLEATTAGISPHGNWKRQRTPTLVQNRRHSYDMVVTTDNKGGSSDWRLHVKLIWDRPFPVANVTKELRLAFDAACAPQTGSGGIVAASP